VFSIGAVDASGIYASFSSTGPTYDGRMKPDVTAQGQGTTVIAGSGVVAHGSGTSFSSPVVAGALACLWQSAPSFSAEQIRAAVRWSASKSTMPDSLYGFGIPDVLKARAILSTPESDPISQNRFILFPTPFSASPMLKGSLNSPQKITIEILSITGQLLHSEKIALQSSSAISLDEFNMYPAGIYFVRVSTGTSLQVIRAVKI
jgi:hypothetical protein